MSATISYSDSLKVDSFIGVKGIVGINGSGQIRNINSCIRFSCNIKIIFIEFRITIEKSDHSL